MLRLGVTRKDIIKNILKIGSVGMASIVYKMKKYRLRSFDYVMRGNSEGVNGNKFRIKEIPKDLMDR